MSEETYNGWTNYETWNVNLWLANEEPLYRDVQGLADRSIGPEELALDILVYVEDLWRQPWADSDEVGHFGDLRADEGDSLDDVDWLEIAEAWLSE